MRLFGAKLANALKYYLFSDGPVASLGFSLSLSSVRETWVLMWKVCIAKEEEGNNLEEVIWLRHLSPSDRRGDYGLGSQNSSVCKYSIHVQLGSGSCVITPLSNVTLSCCSNKGRRFEIFSLIPPWITLKMETVQSGGRWWSPSY